MHPETRYARSGDVSIAYQVVGEGPFDLVFVPPFVTHVELWWSLPSFAPVLRRYASFSRLILFDKRGTGMSDRVSGAPTLESRMDDLRAVLDAAGSTRAALFGSYEGAPMSLLFTAMNREIDVRNVLPAIRVPTLLMHGTEDAIVPIEVARYMAEQIPGAQLSFGSWAAGRKTSPIAY